ncbi:MULTISPECIES: hypothetical protein [unclassified Tolypothrix]|nr:MULTISPECIES: hypothetical protein [unclassified Tolypothrix]EKF05857.1 hypothetical protein FDUTEX481_00718 [Tolypothrix sp. PCC 7601]
MKFALRTGNETIWLFCYGGNSDRHMIVMRMVRSLLLRLTYSI